MLDEVRIQNFKFPTPIEVFFQAMGEQLAASADLSSVFTRNFKPNANQRRLNALIETSQVPEGEHLHILLYGGVGSGKTWAVLSYVLNQMLRNPAVHALAIRRTAGDIALSLMEDTTKFLDMFGVQFKKREKPVPQVELPNLSKMFFRSDKSLVQTGKAKADALGSTAYCFAILEESDSISETLATTIPGRMRGKAPGLERKIIFYICNPPSRNHWLYRKFFEDNDPNDPHSPYRAIHMPQEGNAEHLDPGYISSVERDYSKDPSHYRRMVGGEFGPDTPGDAIYQPHFNYEVHVSKVPLDWNPRYPVVRFWDFGHSGMPCVYAQDDLDRRQIRILHERMVQRQLLEPFLKEVINDCWVRFPGASFRDFVDPAGRQKTAHGPSYHDIMRKHGCNPEFFITTVEYGVELVASILSEMTYRTGAEIREQIVKPAVLIDPSCTTVIEMFETGYCNKRDTPKGSLDPVKDGYYDHIADAIRYGFVMLRKNGAPKPGSHIRGPAQRNPSPSPRGRFSRRRR